MASAQNCKPARPRRDLGELGEKIGWHQVRVDFHQAMSKVWPPEQGLTRGRWQLKTQATAIRAMAETRRVSECDLSVSILYRAFYSMQKHHVHHREAAVHAQYPADTAFCRRKAACLGAVSQAS